MKVLGSGRPVATSPSAAGAGDTIGSTPALAISELSKRFQRSGGDVAHALDDVALSVDRGEILVLLGPSGCGKTTLLRAVAGLEYPDSGRIVLGGREVFSAGSRLEVAIPSERRNLSMMFQSYALWPHMNVLANVAYPMRMRRMAKTEAHARARVALKRTGIASLEAEFPHQISGGQQQRVALSRAIVAESPIVLFDEPLSNVDAKVRTELRAELISLQAELGFAALYVTHDQGEAMEMGHRIAVMHQGRIVQVGTARDIYERPQTGYVARFVGAVNEIAGVVRSVGAEVVEVDTSYGTLAVRKDPSSSVRNGDEVVLFCRPESVAVSANDMATTSGVAATVERSLYLGSHVDLFLRAGETAVQARVSPDGAPPAGAAVRIGIPPQHLHMLARAEAA